MTDRVMVLVAAVALALTLAACGGADKKPQTRPDTTPNGSITTQPDTNGTAPDTTPDGRMTDGRTSLPALGDSPPLRRRHAPRHNSCAPSCIFEKMVYYIR